WLGRRILRSVDRYIPGRGAPHEQGRQSCDEERPYHRKRLVQDRRQIREAYERVTRATARVQGNHRSCRGGLYALPCKRRRLSAQVEYGHVPDALRHALGVTVGERRAGGRFGGPVAEPCP